MSEASEVSARGDGFSVRAVLALIAVGVVALAGLAVLGAYAPELRNGNDGRAHALSLSAVGYAGAPILLKGLGAPTVVSRMRPPRGLTSVVVLTPDIGLSATDLQAYPKGAITLIVLPKWWASPDPLRRGFVRKGPMVEDAGFEALLKPYAPKTRLAHRNGWASPTLRGVDGALADAGTMKLGRVDRLRTISGPGWAPLLVDEAGNPVLVQSIKSRGIWVLADPDLLNNQGLKSLDTAGVAWRILDAAREGERSVTFDVTLNGLGKDRGLWRLMLEPPWVAATLIAVAAALLMGFHALARFGQPHRRGRAFDLGAAALVDNSAGLVRMARKEHELAPAYAALTRALVIRAGGGHAQESWLDELARRRGAAAPGDLNIEAEQAKTRDDLLSVARKLYDWRGEMTRERR